MDPVIQQLQWALQALARPADEQISLFPDGVIVPDELASDFGNWSNAARPKLTLSHAQDQRLIDLDTALVEMSPADCWTSHALLIDQKWMHVRRLAKAALAAFGWPEGRPPSERSTYVFAGPLSAGPRTSSLTRSPRPA
jgi:hypothetical protein